MSSWIVTNLWLIPAVPLAASLAILGLANSRNKAAAALAIFGQVVALTMSVAAFLPTLQTPGYRVIELHPAGEWSTRALRCGTS